MTIEQFLDGHTRVFIKQVKEWSEIVFNFETRNKYHLCDEQGNSIGLFYEKGTGIGHFLKRLLLRSHRSLEIELRDNQGQMLLTLHRPFFFFFSDLEIRNAQGVTIGHVFRKFSFFSKRYELCDAGQSIFGWIKSPFWRLWSFKVMDSGENEMAEIAKKWGGALKEIFTDADQFGVAFGSAKREYRAILLGAAISIDFDFFEDNNQK